MPSVGPTPRTPINFMISYINIIITTILFPFFAYLALITVAALWRRRWRRGVVVPTRPARFRFVIPAHDEEGNIRSTIESCRSVSYDPALYRVSVIADNCSDGTARAARAAGAEVFERNDPVRRSKGHALESFFQHRPRGTDELEAVVLIDADTVVDPGILSAFAVALAEGKDWIQCYYTVRNPDASWRTRLMTYAFSLFNGVWLLGQDRLGLGVGLKGNGMCFSTRGLARFPWKAHGLTEDLEFSWMLRVAGERIHFLPGTHVFGTMPSRGGPAAAAQRRRWEAGRKAQRGSFFGALLRSRRIGPYAKIMYLTDLFFPPLVTLLLGLLVATSLHLGARFDAPSPPMSRWLFPVHCGMAVVLACYALSPFFALRLPFRYLASLAALPYYAVWKLLFITGRNPTSWVRTPREPATCDGTG
jgi:cellulose synthase/poly-beta-1,6-N-acetylglucosamine synthase-like glycosyltransferase